MKTFSSVAQMKLAYLTAGQLVETTGYYVAGDGGGARYLVSASATVDNLGDHDLAGTTVAILQIVDVANVKCYGALGNGVLVGNEVFFKAAAAANDKILVPYDTTGVYLFNGICDIATAIQIICEPGVVISKQTAVKAFEITPLATDVSTLAITQASRTTAQFTGAAWTVNEHAGKWAKITTAFNSADRQQFIPIVSNTADILTLLRETGVEGQSGDACEIYDPIDYVDIEKLTIQGNGNSGANVVMKFANRITLRDVISLNSTITSNAITINQCKDVHVYGGRGDDCQMALFIYNSDHVRVYGFEGKNAGFQHTNQLKDCRDAFYIACKATSGANNSATSGFDIRASGLHLSQDCGILDSVVDGVDGKGTHIRVLATEGNFYGVPTGFKIIGSQCRNVDGAAAQMSVGTPFLGVTTGITSFLISDVLAISCSQALKASGITTAMTLNNNRAHNIRGIDCTSRTVDMEDFDDLIVDDLYSENAEYGGSGEHVRLDDCLRTIFNRPHFVINHASAGATRCIRELNTSDYTEIFNARIDDDQPTLTLDHAFANSNSFATGLRPRGTNSLTPAVVVSEYENFDGISTFVGADATPSVRLGDTFLTSGTTAITDFDDGYVGKTIKILAMDSIVITDNANIILTGSANYSMTVTDTLILTMFAAGVWSEVGRSVN